MLRVRHCLVWHPLLHCAVNKCVIRQLIVLAVLCTVVHLTRHGKRSDNRHKKRLRSRDMLTCPNSEYHSNGENCLTRSYTPLLGLTTPAPVLLCIR